MITHFPLLHLPKGKIAAALFDGITIYYVVLQSGRLEDGTAVVCRNEEWIDAAVDDRGGDQRWLVSYCLMSQEYFLRFFLSDHDRCGMILFGMVIEQLLFAIAGYGGSGQPAMPIADHLAVL
jgi:hypothetical protein